MIDTSITKAEVKDMAKLCKVTGKVKIRTELDAKIALAGVEYIREVKLRKKGNKSEAKPKRYYQCEFCNRFHLTSQEQDVGRQRRHKATAGN